MVYLNIDDNEPAWRRVLKNQKLEGVNIKADEATSRKIKDDREIATCGGEYNKKFDLTGI